MSWNILEEYFFFFSHFKAAAEVNMSQTKIKHHSRLELNFSFVSLSLCFTSSCMRSPSRAVHTLWTPGLAGPHEGKKKIIIQIPLTVCRFLSCYSETICVRVYSTSAGAFNSKKLLTSSSWELSGIGKKKWEREPPKEREGKKEEEEEKGRKQRLMKHSLGPGKRKRNDMVWDFFYFFCFKMRLKSQNSTWSTNGFNYDPQRQLRAADIWQLRRGAAEENSRFSCRGEPAN